MIGRMEHRAYHRPRQIAWRSHAVGRIDAATCVAPRHAAHKLAAVVDRTSTPTADRLDDTTHPLPGPNPARIRAMLGSPLSLSPDYCFLRLGHARSGAFWVLVATYALPCP